MKNIIILIMSIVVGSTGMSTTEKTDIKNVQAIVDRIEDNNIAVVELSYNDEIKLIDISQEDFVNPKREGEKINISTIKGRFYTRFKDSDRYGNTQTFYEFRSNDDSIRWILSTEEIAGIDNDNSKCSFEELERVENIPDYESEYTLIYYDNGTDKNNKPCDCPKEWQCECEVYDDIFLAVVKN